MIQVPYDGFVEGIMSLIADTHGVTKAGEYCEEHIPLEYMHALRHLTWDFRLDRRYPLELREAVDALTERLKRPVAAIGGRGRLYSEVYGDPSVEEAVAVLTSWVELVEKVMDALYGPDSFLAIIHCLQFNEGYVWKDFWSFVCDTARECEDEDLKKGETEVDSIVTQLVQRRVPINMALCFKIAEKTKETDVWWANDGLETRVLWFLSEIKKRLEQCANVA